MYVSGLVLFIALEIFTVVLIVSALLLRLYIKRLKSHGATDSTDEHLKTLAKQANDGSPIAKFRQSFYQNELNFLSNKLTVDAYAKKIQQLAPTEKPSQSSELDDASKQKITQLEDKLAFTEGKLAESIAAIQKLSKKEIENIKPITPGGEQVDEIYRLKCDKNDLQERINDLSMQLDALIPDKKDQLTSMLLEQVDMLKQAAQESDKVIALLEAQLAEGTAGKPAETGEPIDDNLKIPDEAPADWAQFRQSMQQSIDALSAQIVELRSKNDSHGEESDAEEARKLLSVFVQDSQEMMHCINELETENGMLKQQISELQVMVDSGGNIEAANKIKALKQELSDLKSQLEAPQDS